MSNALPRPRDITRTWFVREYARYEPGTSPVPLGRATVTLAADHAGVITATVNGQPATEGAAVALLNRCKACGTVELVKEIRMCLGKPAASSLHRDLARIGALRANHYQIASAALGRTIASFTHIQAHEVDTVLAFTSSLIRGAA
ncbi:hypothetical protein [Deinococcus rufus]|uniref:Uncharacterized protein n=1 Tax=Deinococcus rufus TaxID=2136097 RepID=A0ABV7Z9L2_9DEIO